LLRAGLHVDEFHVFDYGQHGNATRPLQRAQAGYLQVRSRSNAFYPGFVARGKRYSPCFDRLTLSARCYSAVHGFVINGGTIWISFLSCH